MAAINITIKKFVYGYGCATFFAITIKMSCEIAMTRRFYGYGHGYS
jgi:hypothetical protein